MYLPAKLTTLALIITLTGLATPASAQLRDLADRLEGASERFRDASRQHLGNGSSDAAQQLLRESDQLENLADDLAAEVRRAGNPRVLNARSAEIFDAMSIRRNRISAVIEQSRPSQRMRNEWGNTDRLMRQIRNPGKATTQRQSSNTPAPAGFGGHVDQIEDAAERTKNAFRDHVRRHGELKNKGWVGALDGGLSAFDQDANALRDNFRKRNAQSPAIVDRMKTRAAAISEAIENQAVGPTARAQWQRVMNNLNRL